MIRFIIFANARTGSTSLAKLLGESPDVRMCIEPFHDKYSVWNPSERDYSQYIKDESTLSHALEEIFSKYNAFKCLNYQFDEFIYLKLLARKDIKVLFLTRKNTVLSAISSLVARQTNAWYKDEAEKLGYGVYDKLQAIQVAEIKKIVDYTDYENKLYGDFLEANRSDAHLRLYYEELYSTGNEKNHLVIEGICNFLRISVPPDGAINKYMNPHLAHINTNGAYKKIPNIKEIEEKFGKLY